MFEVSVRVRPGGCIGRLARTGCGCNFAASIRASVVRGKLGRSIIQLVSSGGNRPS